MFGLDNWIASLSDGTALVMVLGVAVLLGLRHATDPDHLAAVTTLLSSDRERGGRGAGKLGLAWGSGHATTLFAFGVPIVLFKAFLPEPVQQGAETTVGLVIIALAVWLLVRWRRGLFHLHLHAHDGGAHLHGHVHPSSPHGHAVRPARTPWQAYAIGLVHGMGGSAGVGVLLLATIHDRAVALAALGLFAVCTAISMTVLSSGFGMTLSSRRVARSFERLAPLLGLASLAFGVWYALGAVSLVPYYF
jgi:ABC-type nickel/cobalt efflux system permease component RcnA